MARGKFRSTWVAFRAPSPPGPLSMNGEGEIPKYLGCIPRNLTPWPPLHEWRGGFRGEVVLSNRLLLRIKQLWIQRELEFLDAFGAGDFLGTFEGVFFGGGARGGTGAGLCCGFLDAVLQVGAGFEEACANF